MFKVPNSCTKGLYKTILIYIFIYYPAALLGIIFRLITGLFFVVIGLALLPFLAIEYIILKLRGKLK